MKPHVFNKRGTKQLINSGWKLFDKQTNAICTGNCFLNTQISSYIRPWKETTVNGYKFPEGHCMEFDLKQFGRFRIPEHILELIRDRQREDSVILYMFFTTDRMGRIEPFGWAVTSKDYELLAAHTVWYPNKHLGRRAAALNEAIAYITKKY